MTARANRTFDSPDRLLFPIDDQAWHQLRIASCQIRIETESRREH